MYEYKVIKAPEAPRRKLFRLRREAYADVLTRLFNKLALDDWEFQRAENSPEKTASYLVFRRAVARLDGEMASYQPAKKKPAPAPVKPRAARELLDRDKRVVERLLSGDRRIKFVRPAEPGSDNAKTGLPSAKVSELRPNTDKPNQA